MSAGTVDWIDTTLREVIAPPLGTGVSTEQVLLVAEALASVGATCLEVLDPLGAQRTLERWGESPWDRLRAIVRMTAGATVGIYVAGRTLFGDRPVDADLVRRLVLCAAESGARRVRAFDPLNHADALGPVADAAREAGIAFVPTLHVGPAPTPGDPRWLDEAASLAALPGTQAITLADGGCHLPPAALAALVGAVAKRTGLPVEVAVVSTGDLATTTALAAIDAGAAAIHACVGAAALVAGRPSAETLRAALAGTPRPLRCERVALHRATDVVLPTFTGEMLRQGVQMATGPALGLPPKLAVGLSARLRRMGMPDRLVEASSEASAVAGDCGGLIVMHPFGGAIVAQAALHVTSAERWGEMVEPLADAVLGRWGPLRGPVSPEAEARASASAKLDGAAVDATPADVAATAPPGISEEDMILWAQFPVESRRLIERRRSIEDETWQETVPALDRDLLNTLVSVMEESGGVEVSVELHGARITARPAGAAPAPVATGGAGTTPPPQDAHGGLTPLESPIVGTFYRASSPEADPFVREGTRVEVGQVLCIIEAMKIFNEILADTAGVVRSIAVENAEPVEFGQVLFLIEP